jgi:hypothetical protein
VAEQKGFLTALAEPLGEAAARHHASSPRDKSFTRAGGGAFLLTGCAYTAAWSPVFLGDSFEALVAAFLRALALRRWRVGAACTATLKRCSIARCDWMQGRSSRWCPGAPAPTRRRRGGRVPDPSAEPHATKRRSMEGALV